MLTLVEMERSLSEVNPKSLHAVKTRSMISFFSGCGGLDLGFLGGFTYMGRDIPQLPFELVGAYDNDQRAVETFKQNVSPLGEVRDLAKLDASELPAAEVLIGGFPCQDFASGGPRLGLNSPRGQLYKSLLAYMRVHRPLVLVGENVPGLATIEKGDVLDRIKEEIEQLEYKVKIWNLYAPDYGVPQKRSRLFIIARRDDLHGFPELPPPTHRPEDYPTSQWALADLESITDEAIPNQSQYFRASKAKRGNGQGDEITPADSPAYTVRANPKSRVQFHYNLPRRLTIRECARLQTFPDAFAFPHSATTNIMQIGNAVPPLLGNAVALAISKYLETIA